MTTKSQMNAATLSAWQIFFEGETNTLYNILMTTMMTTKSQMNAATLSAWQIFFECEAEGGGGGWTVRGGGRRSLEVGPGLVKV